MRRLAFSLMILTAMIPLPLRADWFDWASVTDGLTWSLRNLTYAQFQEPSAFAIDIGASTDIPERLIENDIRADLTYTRGPFLVGLKPRANVFWQSWDSGARSGEDQSSGEVYFYEWLVRASVGSQAFVEYGLQNLQWGPSFLLSPSNPFDERNGKENPYVELPESADYARLIWVLSPSWTLSAIANVGEGRKRYLREFYDTYALKVDYQFQDGYASLITSYRDDDQSDYRNDDSSDLRVGYYAGYNISDRILGYVEGSASDLDTQTLIGTSYTTDLGPTIALEYFFNSGGDRSTDIRELFLQAPYDLEWREALARKNYVLIQGYQQNLFGSLDYVLRWVTNIDDQSHSVNVQLEYGLSDAISLFTVATVNSGEEDSELAAVRDYQVMGGVELAF
jgi:hypothetical protein